MSQNHIFSILGRGNLFYFLIMLFSFSHFPPHHRKWALLEKCVSFIWHPLKSDFSESAYFHSFAPSDRGEDISNLRKDTFAKFFCGILFWELFCAGNVFCETVSNFLILLTTICHTRFTYNPTVGAICARCYLRLVLFPQGAISLGAISARRHFPWVLSS